MLFEVDFAVKLNTYFKQFIQPLSLLIAFLNARIKLYKFVWNSEKIKITSSIFL